ncbi:hypothetical protein D9M71_390380 [compost metagenome]
MARCALRSMADSGACWVSRKCTRARSSKGVGLLGCDQFWSFISQPNVTLADLTLSPRPITSCSEAPVWLLCWISSGFKGPSMLYSATPQPALVWPLALETTTRPLLASKLKPTGRSSTTWPSRITVVRVALVELGLSSQ